MAVSRRAPGNVRKPGPSTDTVGDDGRDTIEPLSSSTLTTTVSHPPVHLVPPCGHSLAAAIMMRDPIPWPLQILFVITSVIGLVSLPLLPILLSSQDYPWLHTSWDEDNAVTLFSGSALRACLGLIEKTLGLSTSEVLLAAIAAALPLLALAAAETLNLLGALDPPAAWPRSWSTSNTRCYHEMFCEPTRPGRCVLVRRPGNTYSNYVYFLGSACILLSLLRHRAPGDPGTDPFWAADAVFALMLGVLGALSTVWHSSNAPVSHYLDLWSMDSCIVFLIVRYSCQALRAALTSVAHGGVHAPQSAPGLTCTAVFGALMVGNGRFWWGKYRSGWLDKGCPFAGRSRLLRQVLDQQAEARGEEAPAPNRWPPEGKIHTLDACVYAALPVFYMALPVVVQLCVLRSTGSLLAGTAASACLVTGWVLLRMFERFCLDGWPPMAYVRALMMRPSKNDRDCSSVVDGSDEGSADCPSGWLVRVSRTPAGSAALTAAAAVASPTAILHFLSGVTLLVGYMHSRSLGC